MAFYMMQAGYDNEATVASDTSEERGEIIAAQLREMGGRLISYSERSGKYDAVAIFEVPDDLAAGAFTIAVRDAARLKDAKAAKLRGAVTNRLEHAAGTGCSQRRSA